MANENTQTLKYNNNKIPEAVSESSDLKQGPQLGKKQIIQNGVRTQTVLATAVENLEPNIVIQNLTSAELTDELSDEFSDFYTTIFRNLPYGQFIFHKSNPLKPITPQEAFNQPDKDYFTQEELENYQLPPGYHYCMDIAEARKINKERLRSNAYITRIVNEETGKTIGLVFGRKASLREIFETEEMQNPILMSEHFDQNVIADEDKFFEKMKYHFNFEPDSPNFYFSCLGIDPSVRNKSYFYDLMKSISGTISDEDKKAFFFAEIPDSGAAHYLHSSMAERIIFGVLENGHSIMAVSELGNYLKNFDLTREQLYEKVKNHKKEKNSIYKHNPKNNSKIEVRDIPEIGRAVFNTDKIKAGERIAVFEGEKYNSETELELPKIMVNHTIQIGETEHIHAHGELAELLNHSCDPNCGIRADGEIFAIRDIQPGEELTWDYRMTEDSNWVLEECQCGTERCTGRVEGYASLPEATKNEYFRKGAVANWLKEKYHSIR